MKRCPEYILLTMFTAAVASLCGCSSGKYAAIRIHLSPQAQLCPGSEVDLALFYVDPKGKEKPLPNRQYPDYNIVSAQGKYSGGKFILSEDARVFTNHKALVEAASTKNPALTDHAELLLSYIGPQVARFSGRNGSAGERGANRSGFLLIGRDGNDGGSGGNGTDGENAGDLIVYAEAVYDSILKTDCLKVRCAGVSGEACYYVNVNGGSLLVQCHGGSGGSGGNGGYGGDGKDGCRGCGSKGGDKDSGNGGSGGNGGNGGSGGDGAKIIFCIDTTRFVYGNLVTIDNSGGAAGAGGNGGDAGKGGAGVVKEGVAGTPDDDSGDWYIRPGKNGYEGSKGTGGEEGKDGALLIRHTPGVRTW